MQFEKAAKKAILFQRESCAGATGKWAPAWPRFEYLKKIIFFHEIFESKTKNRHFSIGLEAKFFKNGLKIRECRVFSEL